MINERKRRRMTKAEKRTGREYRGLVRAEGLTGFFVRVAQTDLFIRAEHDLTAEARDLVKLGRRRIETWAKERPEFLTSLKPLPD
ncbi:MAG: hypothetical protein SV487_02180, partial [Thermodesulfobacteriota bacterium]|nr:hypothetical protein [Thermodesulfobacteriota bacterium]